MDGMTSPKHPLDTLYRRPAFEGRLSASATLTANGEDGSRDDRGSLQASYVRYRGQRLFISAVTVRSHVSSILRKLRVPNRAGAVRVLRGR